MGFCVLLNKLRKSIFHDSLNGKVQFYGDLPEANQIKELSSSNLVSSYMY